MNKDSPGKRLLENAYQLETPTDNITYYNELADSYDQDFANELGYALPQAVAEKFKSLVTPADTPVVDVGCGTGLLGEALDDNNVALDGLDIAIAMLAQARKRKKYRHLYEVDLTGDLSRYNQAYGAVLSSGTFTHGHLGSDSLVKLLDIARPNGLFVIAINQTHYESMGFDRAIEKLDSLRAIHELRAEPVGIYRQTDHAHSADIGLIVSFRKT